MHFVPSSTSPSCSSLREHPPNRTNLSAPGAFVNLFGHVAERFRGEKQQQQHALTTQNTCPVFEDVSTWALNHAYTLSESWREMWRQALLMFTDVVPMYKEARVDTVLFQGLRGAKY